MKDLVNRFLNWPLPPSVCSDLCATMPNYPHRTGTTLLNATEAEQMLEYMMGPTLDENKRLQVENGKMKKVLIYLQDQLAETLRKNKVVTVENENLRDLLHITESWDHSEDAINLFQLKQQKKHAEFIITSLKDEREKLRKEFKTVVLRMKTLVGRMRGCHEETGKHELIDEAQAFVDEAEEALKEMEKL